MTKRVAPPADDAGGPRYALRPSVEPFVDRHGTLCLVQPGGQDLVVRDPDRADVALIRRLEGTCDTAEGLAASIGAPAPAVQAKLDSLVAAGLVLTKDASPGPALAGEDGERFSRQLPYLAELGDELRLQHRLRDASVAVIGCGGLGTWAIAALACIGVGRLLLADDDDVELSNLNRQILYARRDVGAAKVTASANWLRAFDPAIDVTAVKRRIAAAADVGPAIAGADVVVLAADWPPYEIARWVNAACAEARLPFIVAGQVPPVLKIGPTYAPGSGACFACHEKALAETSSAYEDYVAHRMSHPVDGQHARARFMRRRWLDRLGAAPPAHGSSPCHAGRGAPGEHADAAGPPRAGRARSDVRGVQASRVMKGEERQDPVTLVARLARHPLRQHVLFKYTEAVTSPSAVAAALGARVNLVSYHTGVLLRAGVIELVRTERRRGATEHFYRAALRGMIEDGDWERLPATVRRGLVRGTIDGALTGGR